MKCVCGGNLLVSHTQSELMQTKRRRQCDSLKCKRVIYTLEVEKPKGLPKAKC